MIDAVNKEINLYSHVISITAFIEEVRGFIKRDFSILCLLYAVGSCFFHFYWRPYS